MPAGVPRPRQGFGHRGRNIQACGGSYQVESDEREPPTSDRRAAPSTAHSRRAPPRPRAGAPRRAPPPRPGPSPTSSPPDTAAERVRESGGPTDLACYACHCGYVFAAAGQHHRGVPALRHAAGLVICPPTVRPVVFPIRRCVRGVPQLWLNSDPVDPRSAYSTRRYPRARSPRDRSPRRVAPSHRSPR